MAITDESYDPLRPWIPHPPSSEHSFIQQQRYGSWTGAGYGAGVENPAFLYITTQQRDVKPSDAFDAISRWHDLQYNDAQKNLLDALKAAANDSSSLGGFYQAEADYATAIAAADDGFLQYSGKLETGNLTESDIEILQLEDFELSADMPVNPLIDMIDNGATVGFYLRSEYIFPHVAQNFTDYENNIQERAADLANQGYTSQQIQETLEVPEIDNVLERLLDEAPEGVVGTAFAATVEALVDRAWQIHGGLIDSEGNPILDERTEEIYNTYKEKIGNELIVSDDPDDAKDYYDSHGHRIDLERWIENDALFFPQTVAATQADQILNSISQIVFPDDTLKFVAIGSALRAIGSLTVDDLQNAAAFDVPDILGRYSLNFVGSIGGTTARELVTNLLDDTEVPDSVVGTLAIFAQDAATPAAQLAALALLKEGYGFNEALAVSADEALLRLDPEVFFTNAAVSAVSSFAATQLTSLLDIDPELAHLLAVPTTAAINQLSLNVLHGLPWNAGFSLDTFNALGSASGAFVADEIGNWDSTGEIIGSRVGTLIGSFAIPIPIVGSFIGAVIGDLLGGFLGGLIGGQTPEAWADVEFNLSTGLLEITDVSANDGGSKDLAKGLAKGVRDNANTALMAIGGEMLNSVAKASYGHVAADAEAEYSDGDQNYHDDYDALVRDGVFRTLSKMEIAGGDVYAKRALEEWVKAAAAGNTAGGQEGDLAHLNNDLIVAKDFEKYLDNIVAINALIAADPAGEAAIGWEMTLQQAYHIGLQRRHESDWIGGWDWRLQDLQADASQAEPFYYDGERTILVRNDDGLNVVEDQVPSHSKDTIVGGDGSDRIIVSVDRFDVDASRSADPAGVVTFDGGILVQDLPIGVAAELDGGGGHDALFGGDLGNDLFGGNGNDLLQGGKLDDWLFGGAGNDRLFVLGGSGNYASGGNGDDTILGGSGSDWLDGDDGSDTLTAGAEADILNGGKGDDALNGGDDGDIYLIRPGDGSDRISDVGTDVGVDRLQMDGVTSADVAVHLSSTSEDILLALASADGGNVIVLANQALGQTTGIDEIEFADSAWSRMDLLAHASAVTAGVTLTGTSADEALSGTLGDDVLASGAGNDELAGSYGSDTYTFLLGDGQDIISDSGSWGDVDRIVLGGGIAAGNLDVQHSSGAPDDVTLHVAGTSDSVVLASQDRGPGFGIEEVAFADGTIWTPTDIQNAYLVGKNTSGADTVIGFAGDEIISTGTGNDTIAGGRGNDMLLGGGGSDIYSFDLGDGHDIISETNTSGTDRLVFGVGIAPTDIFVNRSAVDSSDLLLSVLGTDDQVLLDWQEYGGGTLRSVEEVAFQDGTIWTKEDLRVAYLRNATTTGDDFILGFNSADSVEGGKGNDVLQAGFGSDTYTFNIGDGYDRIYEASESDANATDRIVFGAGVDTTDVTVEQSALSLDDLVLRIGTDGDTIYLGDQTRADNGIEQIAFADGTIWSKADLIARSILGVTTDRNDVIDGFVTVDELEGGLGNDVLQGGSGGDSYDFNIGDGIDWINDSGNSDTAATDRLVLGAGITTADVKILRSAADSNDLIIQIGGGDAVYVNNQDYSTAGVEEVAFADGTVWSAADLSARESAHDAAIATQAGTSGADNLVGTGGDDRLQGGDGNDELEGGAGDDVLDGGGGSDIYRFDLSSGHDTIVEDHSSFIPATTDRLILGQGITPENLIVSKFSAGNMFLQVDGHDASIYLVDQGNHDRDTIEEIDFANGVVWSAADLRAEYISQNATPQGDLLFGSMRDDDFTASHGNDTLIGDAGADIYHMGIGSGQDVIIDTPANSFGSDTLIVGSGVRPEDLEISKPNSDDVLIKIAGYADSMLIAGQDDRLALTTCGIDNVIFDDGTMWTRSDLRAAYIAQHVTAGGDRVDASGFDDTIQGGPGDDVLIGNEGVDTYHFDLGDGHDIIQESYSLLGNTILVFGEGIRPDDIVVTIPANESDDMLLSIAGGPDSVYLPEQNGLWSGVDQVKFADGTIWSRADLNARAATEDGALSIVRGTSADDVLFGATTSDELIGSIGNDALIGGQGSDSYRFNLGDGRDRIRDDGAASDVDQLVFGSGILPDQIIISASPSDANDIVLQIGGTEDAIYLDDQKASSSSGIEQVIFSNGVTWSRVDLDPTDLASRYSTGDDIIYGTVFADTLTGAEGIDVLRGGYGSDSYEFNLGDGQDTIDDIGAEADVDELVLGAGISVADLRIGRPSNAPEDLTIAVDGTTDEITLHDQNGGPDHGIENVRLSDGTVLDAADLRQMYLNQAATAGNDTIIGFAGVDDLSGGLGDDMLDGGDGADTFHYMLGDGQDNIDDLGVSGGVDVLALGSGISANDVQVARGEVDTQWTLSFAGAAGAINLRLSSDDPARGIEQIAFADSQVWTYTDVKAVYLAQAGTSQADEILGFESDDVINGGVGDDVISGDRGADQLIGGDGNDVLDGGDGNDTLDGGAGDDVLRGGFGSDSYQGGAGFDMFDLVHTATAWTVDIGSGIASTANATESFSGIEGAFGGYGNDTLIGDGGDNRLVGRDGDDILQGGDGDDLLEGGAGADQLDGGTGNDTASYLGSAQAVVVDLAMGTTNGGDAVGDVLVSIENATGGAGNDTLAGNSGSNVLDGKEGDDTLVGGVGDDLVQGDGGSDTYQYADGDGADILLDSGSSTDTDVLSLGTGLNPADAVLLLSAADANDITVTFIRHPGSILLDNQLYSGSYGIEQIHFDDGTIWDRTDIATKAHFNQVPTAADDVGNAVEASPIVMAAADLTANDSDADGDGLSIEGVSNAVGGVAVLTLAGDVVFAPTNGFTGTAGYDYTVSDGVGGTDTAHVTLTITADPTPIGTTVNGTSGDDSLGATADRDTMYGGAGDDGLFGGAGNDVLYGEDGNDSLDGEDGDNLLIGGAGDDWMIAEGGNDRFDGGDGFDAVDFSGFSTGGFYDLLGGSYQIGTVVGTMTAVEWLNLAGGDDVVRGDANYNSVYAGAGNDQVFAGDGDDDINGGDGNDTLYGEGGADILQGGIGDDTINGGAGNDTWLFGGDGADYIDGGDGDDEISGGVGDDQLYGGAGADSVVGDAGNDIINGGSGDDTWLAGGDGDDLIRGGAGNDEMSGDGGADQLYGDAGADDLNGGAGNDSLYGGLDNDTLNGDADDDLLDGGAGDDFLNGGAGADQLLGGTGIDELTGGDGDDSLAGGAGDDDWIEGSAGNDTLAGNAGNDALNGGAGDDTYQFGRGDGFDIVFNSDTTSTSDEVLFGTGIATDQLWFMQQGDDLSVSIVGTQDSVTIKDWYTDTDVSMNFETGDDGSTLAKASVQQLVDAMAQFDAPSGTDTELPPSYQQALEPTIAAAWQTS